MIIYLLRHGHAKPQVTTDDARQLTAKGIAETEEVVARRCEALAKVTSVWASPLVRAQQTAQIARQYCPDILVQTTELLVPEADPLQVIDGLYRHQASLGGVVLLVSHQPIVGRLLGLLCGKPEGFYAMGTSSLAAVEIELPAANLGSLTWLDHPTP